MATPIDPPTMQTPRSAQNIPTNIHGVKNIIARSLNPPTIEDLNPPPTTGWVYPRGTKPQT